jgi:hypothetical protein
MWSDASALHGVAGSKKLAAEIDRYDFDSMIELG